MRRFIYISLLLFLLLPLGLLLLQLVQGVRPHAESYAGLPRAQAIRPWPWAPQWFHVIDPPGFVLGYSEYWRNPLWVAYRLDQRIEGTPAARPRHFTVDRRTWQRVSADDYRRSGYDRGHLAPNYAMSRFHGREAQLASFRMSNIVPQRALLNQKLWQRLEEVETDVYAAQQGGLWVLMGPVFSEQPRRLDSGLAVPRAFYRIWLRESDKSGVQVLAFLVPQQVSGYEALDEFLVSVDRIEAETGLDFFHLLPDEQENALESSVDAAAWRFARHARHPPRY